MVNAKDGNSSASVPNLLTQMSADKLREAFDLLPATDALIHSITSGEMSENAGSSKARVVAAVRSAQKSVADSICFSIRNASNYRPNAWDSRSNDVDNCLTNLTFLLYRNKLPN